MTHQQKLRGPGDSGTISSVCGEERGEIYQTRNLCPVKYPSKMKAKKKSSNNRKLRESTVTRLIQQEMLNNVFQAKVN